LFPPPEVLFCRLSDAYSLVAAESVFVLRVEEGSFSIFFFSRGSPRADFSKGSFSNSSEVPIPGVFFRLARREVILVRPCRSLFSFLRGRAFPCLVRVFLRVALHSFYCAGFSTLSFSLTYHLTIFPRLSPVCENVACPHCRQF